MQIFLGAIAIYNTDDGIQLKVNGEPFLRKDYDELEGNGETLLDALADLQEQMEELPQ